MRARPQQGRVLAWHQGRASSSLRGDGPVLKARCAGWARRRVQENASFFSTGTPWREVASPAGAFLPSRAQRLSSARHWLITPCSAAHCSASLARRQLICLRAAPTHRARSSTRPRRRRRPPPPPPGTASELRHRASCRRPGPAAALRPRAAPRRRLSLCTTGLDVLHAGDRGGGVSQRMGRRRLLQRRGGVFAKGTRRPDVRAQQRLRSARCIKGRGARPRPPGGARGGCPGGLPRGVPRRAPPHQTRISAHRGH